MTYSESLEFIHSINRRGRKRPLSMTAQLLSRVGSPERKLRFVHVAGTNGKGSVSAYIESILRRAGLRTGLFTSPFVTRFNERIRVNGDDIPDEDLAATLEELLPALEGLDVQPSEFELVTVLGLMYFAKRRCDIVVLEVGVGGALDATNVIPQSEVSVIGALGLDHTAYLGGTLREIALAKAGIVKPRGRAVIYGDVDGVIAGVCRERGAELTELDPDKVHILSSGLDGSRMSYGMYGELSVPLAGSYQPLNAALALEVVDVLRRSCGFRIDDEDIRMGLAETRWPGRLELLRRSPDFIVDGGHNPQAVSAAVGSIMECCPNKKITFLTGVMADKDVASIVDIISAAAERVITLSPPAHRALDARRYAELYMERGVDARAADSVEEGVRIATELAGEDGVVCAIGSIYLIDGVSRAVRADAAKK